MPQAVKALEYLKPQPNAGPTSWTNGPYAYDGAGDITAIGSEAYVYDKIGRLRTATLRGPDLSSMQTQSFNYDDYGNLISTSKLGQTVLLPASAVTNQLGTLHYDDSGRVDIAGTQHYDYDAVGMVNTVRLGAALQPRIIYAYTADDERLFAFDVSTGITHWTLRGFDNKVLRDFRQQGSTWAVERDYVYRDGLLLAALKASGAVEHYSLDHLGTPRLITDAAGHRIGYHVYWPFGEEWSPGNAQEASALKFTGHERDADPTGGSAPLDYVHARYYGAGWGRFLSPDPLRGNLLQPQSWNRYAYVSGNPINFIDPLGLEDKLPTEDNPIQCGSLDDPCNIDVPSPEPPPPPPPVVRQAFFWDHPRDSIMLYRNPVTDMTVREHARATGYGLMAFADGVIPFGDPLEEYYSDGSVAGTEYSRNVGEYTRDVEIALATSGSQSLFGAGRWVNTGKNFRLGHSTQLVKGASNRVWFSMRGRLVQRVAGRSHLNLWIVRLLPPGIAR